MAKLSDRMMRADIFTDGRLLRVSPEARLLAVVLEALAEPTGMVRMDTDEIRSACGFFLADADGNPPPRDDVQGWCDELVGVKWALDFTDAGMSLLYLVGFGTRQRGYNVAIGAESTNNKPAAHLPMPACVTLEPFEETVKSTGEIRVRKYLPHHCELDYTSCPCEWYPQGSPTQHLPSVDVMEVDLKEVDLESDVSPEERSLEDLRAPGLLASACDDLCKQYPDLDRATLSKAIFELSVPYGDRPVAEAVTKTIAQNPKAPIAYLKKTLTPNTEHH